MAELNNDKGAENCGVSAGPFTRLAIDGRTSLSSLFKRCSKL